MFLTVMVGGVTDARADTTHKLSLNGSASESLNNGIYGSTSFFTVARTSGAINYNPKFKDASYDGINFTSGLKMESNVTISFTTSSISTVTIVQSSLIVNGSQHTITWNGTAQIVPASESGSGYYEYTFENVSAGTHTIGRGSGESGIFYVKVVEHSFTTDYTVTNVTLDGIG